LRHGADGAKLISSNDKDGYTFRGRFTNADQAAGVSSDITQKAHSALRWLIGRRQAHRNGSQSIVAWVVSGKSIPDPLANSAALFGDEETKAPQVLDNPINHGDVGQAFAWRLAQKLRGYKADLGPSQDVIILGLDSATPGRMAVTFYRELKGSDFLKRTEEWHEQFAWPQRFSTELQFIGAPSPRDIAPAAFGSRLDEKLSRATVERLLPCIIDGKPLPRDLMENAVRRTNNRVGMDWWEWERTLGIACSLFRGFHRERKYKMSLETERTTRDYLYGRLLAIAEHIEGRALFLSKENRDTTAARLMQRFSDHPYSTWLTIEKSLQPYKTRLQSKRPTFLAWVTGLLDEVHTLFRAEDYLDDRPLKGEYLLGYHCQRSSLRAEPEKPKDNDDAQDTSND
jgi:CRISPR-associated protein Csd1